MSAAPDTLWMTRALQLARAGRGLVEPNPMVGCVLVRDGKTLAEGFHRAFGMPHAEAQALQACAAAGISPAAATAYVNLEPCCHHGKKTPPCVPLLIQAQLARVVIGCADPNPQVAGQGIAQLRAAGIQVDVGIIRADCQQLNAAFFARMLLQRPYVTLKWAQSADGKVAGPAGQRRQISGPQSMAAAHGLRGRCDAVAVGMNTVLADDPLLTVRHAQPLRIPTRVVLAGHRTLPPTCNLVRTAPESPLRIYSGHDLPAVLSDLAAHGATHVLVEGGPTVQYAFIQQNLADRVWIFRSPLTIGDPTAPDAPHIAYPPVATTQLGDDTLTEYLNPRSPVFFTAAASADFASTSTVP
jgi:diaminohydroxyphosphoribosylaminopyrimidine deaminase/5-amino-6-(5-phosphoribosylamino)uracil reductase